ncbi:MAG: molybdenum cofactor guanylyltransferase [Fidelibacterota bacterium]
MAIPASAYILAGGKSRRFGSPKWRATLNGETLLDRSAQLCRSLFQEWCVVAKKGMKTDPPATVIDRVDVYSPLAGMAAALSHSKRDWTFILSCDMPLMKAGIIKKLWRGTGPGLDAVVPETKRGHQPLCAFYSSSLLSRCERMLAEKEYALTRLIESSTFRAVDYSADEDPFFNVNTPEDLEWVRQELIRTRPSS